MVCEGGIWGRGREVWRVGERTGQGGDDGHPDRVGVPGQTP